MVTVHIPLDSLASDLHQSGDDVESVLKGIGCSIEEGGIEINPNRPDLFSRAGLERAVKHYLLRELRDYEAEDARITCFAEENAVRPVIICAVVRNVTLDETSIKEIIDLQELLHLTLGRKRRFAAIGLHDLSAVCPPFYYRDFSGTRRFVPLGSDREVSITDILKNSDKGVEYGALLENERHLYPILEDSNGDVLSMPPVINGNITALQTRTKDLFIDVTGIDDSTPNTVMNIIVCDLLDRFRGSNAEKVIVLRNGAEKLYPRLERARMDMSLSAAARMLGFSVPYDEAASALKKMGHRATAEGDSIRIEIPCYRSDMIHSYDLFEELAIGYGYERIKPELPRAWTQGRKISERTDTLRELFIGMDFIEVATLNLSSIEEQKTFMSVERACVEVLNPVSKETEIMRFWLIPSLLAILRANRHNALPQRIFECGEVCDMERNVEHAACIIEDSSTDFREIKSVAENVSRAMGRKFDYERKEHPSFIRGRCAAILVEGREIGFCGEMHPKVLRNFQLESPACAMELMGGKI